MANSSQTSAESVIKYFNLQPLPGEGGYFSENYRSNEVIQQGALNGTFIGNRLYGTAIYYLITHTSFSSLHKLKQDEVFHFYLGASAEMLNIYPDGSYRLIRLGPNFSNGEQFQIVVPAGVWQAMRIVSGAGEWSLMGTTCAPGFEYTDLELANIANLKTQFPHLTDLIDRFSHHEK